MQLHISTLRKVDIIDTIIDRAETGSLKVNVSKKHIYGLTFPGIIRLIKETPWLLLIIGLVGYLLGAALEPVVQKTFGTGGN